jgi:hypothetical protein
LHPKAKQCSHPFQANAATLVYSNRDQSLPPSKQALWREGLLEQRKKRQISCRLRIEQRMVDPITNESYFYILTKIASFLNCNLLLRKQVATGNVYYTLTASNSKSLQIIIDYFECYPLYSSKYLDYKD